MECKFKESGNLFFNALIRINRNIVECKWSIFSLVWTLDGELIETLWNVNILDGTAPRVSYNELIETLWNVNMHIKYFC